MIASIVSPRLIRVGGGAVGQIAEVLAIFGLSRPLVVSDPWMVSSGTIDQALAPLRAAGLSPAVFAETVPDPTDTVIEAGVAAFRAGAYDSLIGFGGGSPMDTAKAIAILAAAPAGAKMRAFKVPAQADHGAVPVICIPTTAGTGSEATRFTVITDTETDEKMLIAGLGALPLAFMASTRRSQLPTSSRRALNLRMGARALASRRQGSISPMKRKVRW
jgi:alcohol dehydrogenase class IV